MNLHEEIMEAARLGIAVVDLRKRNLTNDDLDRMGANAPMCAPAPKSKRKAELVEGGFAIETLTWTIPVETASEVNQRDWHKRSKRSDAAWKAVSKVVGPKLVWLTPYSQHYHLGKPIRIHFVRIGGRKLDRSNLASATKHVEDAFAFLMGADDGDDRWKASWEQEAYGGPCGVRVTIEKA